MNAGQGTVARLGFDAKGRLVGYKSQNNIERRKGVDEQRKNGLHLAAGMPDWPTAHSM